MSETTSRRSPHPRQQVLDRIDVFQRTFEAKLDELNAAVDRIPAASWSSHPESATTSQIIIAAAVSAALTAALLATVNSLCRL